MRNVLADLQDVAFTQLPRPGGQHQISDGGGFDFHDAAAGCIHSSQVLAGDQHSNWLWFTLNRSVAFHAHNAVHDREMARECGVKISNALVNAGPMEYVFRPSVNAARDQAEEVLHA